MASVVKENITAIKEGETREFQKAVSYRRFLKLKLLDGASCRAAFMGSINLYVRDRASSFQWRLISFQTGKVGKRTWVSMQAVLFLKVWRVTLFHHCRMFPSSSYSRPCQRHKNNACSVFYLHEVIAMPIRNFSLLGLQRHVLLFFFTSPHCYYVHLLEEWCQSFYLPCILVRYRNGYPNQAKRSWHLGPGISRIIFKSKMMLKD